MLEIKELCVKYDAIQVIHRVSLSVQKGEIVGLIGSNGAGKSTILKTISGLICANSGVIDFEDYTICKCSSHSIVARGIVHVPEGRQIFTKMTIEENLKLGGYLEKNKSNRKRNLERAVTLFPILKERLHQQAGTLSGGEQQMLAIGRALLSNPKLLLLDEPSMGLSPLMTQQVFDVLQELKKEGITILIVEQNAYDALDISDRAYILETGCIRLEGESKDLLKNPKIKNAYLGGD